ncbi:MAG: glycosidase [Bacteroidetes bacterium]|nr:glycosidase [Bacteroidota bacterium]
MHLTRTPVKLTADPSKVILRFLNFEKVEWFHSMLKRFLHLSEDEIESLWKETKDNFSSRHRKYEERMLQNYHKLEKKMSRTFPLSLNAKMLLGAYLSKEYSIKSAGLFNPSIVKHPDQSGLPSGATRFVLSLRCTGEGHTSSISFREGIIDADNKISFATESPYRTPGRLIDPLAYTHGFMKRRLPYLQNFDSSTLKWLPSTFTLNNVKKLDNSPFKNALELLIHENYDVEFDEEVPFGERVLFPISDSEKKGMEDLRLVHMDDNGTSRYLGTFTAYDGKYSLMKLISTEDFRTFKIRELFGKAIKDKGIAFFPRKINGKFAALARQDGESLSLMYSNDYLFWEKKIPLQLPAKPWEFWKIGNCGSPIETPEGWLVLTHGVGPMRKYVLGVSLLDLERPENVIASLKEPLMIPQEGEREGYVPNVLYTCGWMKHGDQILIPYGMSDSACGIAMVATDELLEELAKNKQ